MALLYLLYNSTYCVSVHFSLSLSLSSAHFAPSPTNLQYSVCLAKSADSVIYVSSYDKTWQIHKCRASPFLFMQCHCLFLLFYMVYQYKKKERKTSILCLTAQHDSWEFNQTLFHHFLSYSYLSRLYAYCMSSSHCWIQSQLWLLVSAEEIAWCGSEVRRED